MRKVTKTLRRSTAALAVATGMLAISGPATAATGLPIIASGRADSQALRVQLTLPSVDALKATLAKLGVPTASLPNTGLGGLTLEERISVNHGEVSHNVKGLSNRASGFATAITGVLPVAGELTKAVSSSCTAAGCTNGDAIAAVDQDLAGLGHLKIAGAESITKDLLNTTNHTALATAHIDLESLIAEGAPLAAIGDALRTLTSTINTTVLPPVNGALSTLEGTIADTIEDNAPAVKSQLDKLIKLGTIDPLPDLSKVSLADLTILGAKSDVLSKKVAGVTGVNSIAASKVADISILGGWAGIDAVGITADSFANGVKGKAYGKTDVQIAGVNLGGLLGIALDRDDLAAISNPKALEDAIRSAAKSNGLDANKAEDLINAIELVRNIAGIQAEFFGASSHVDPKGMFADATAGTLALIVEPKIPDLNSQITLPGQTVPQFTKYVSTGVRLRIDLPNASSAASVAANVLNFGPTPHRKTGVGTPFLAAFGLLGLALVVRKFATAK